MRTPTAFCLATIATGMLAWVSTSHALPRPPQIDPADFVTVVDNPYFPLVPGTTFFFEGTDAGEPVTNVTFVTHSTKMILGVQVTIVHDQGFEDGVLAEDTSDWYAQDKDGNVWYFGEDTKQLDHGGNVVSTEGSWEAGVDGARAGIVMLADPEVGDQYRQEFLRDVAEDSARVVNTDASTCVDYGCFTNVLVTKETSRLEPGLVEKKYYAPGIGVILENTVKGGEERLELVNVTTGG